MVNSPTAPALQLSAMWCKSSMALSAQDYGQQHAARPRELHQMPFAALEESDAEILFETF